MMNLTTMYVYTTINKSINQSVKISKVPLNDAQWRHTAIAR